MCSRCWRTASSRRLRRHDTLAAVQADDQTLPLAFSLFSCRENLKGRNVTPVQHDLVAIDDQDSPELIRFFLEEIDELCNGASTYLQGMSAGKVELGAGNLFCHCFSRKGHPEFRD